MSTKSTAAVHVSLERPIHSYLSRQVWAAACLHIIHGISCCPSCHRFRHRRAHGVSIQENTQLNAIEQYPLAHRHLCRPSTQRQASTHAAAGTTAAPEAPRNPPTAKQLLLFALPTLILPLADPLMSLIDTVCIGMYGSVIELAATGPASLLFAAPAVLFSALTATALTDISGAQARGDTAAAGAAFARTLRDAAVAGTLTMALFGLCSTQVVGALSVAPDVLPLAAGYVAVRALAAPATMASSVYSVRHSPNPPSA